MTQVRPDSGRIDVARSQRCADHRPPTPPSGLAQQVAVIHPAELGADEIARWRAFQKADPALANPFLAPEFTIAVGRQRRQARVGVLYDGPKIVGFFAFERHHLGVGGPIAGAINGCQGLVHAPGLCWDPQQLLKACGLAAWKFDHLAPGQVPFDAFHRSRTPSPVMDLSGGYDAYIAAVKANVEQTSSGPRVSLKELAAKERRLARDVGELRFVLDSADPEALHTLMTWKAAQYARTGATDNFARKWTVDLLDTLLETRTEHFSGVLSQLRAGDELVAVQFGLRCGAVLAGWHLTYNTDLPRYSPGLLQILHLARAAVDAGIHTVDMGRGVTPYKTMFSSRQLYVAQGEVVRESPTAALHRLRYASEPGLRRFVSAHPRLLQAAEQARSRGTRLDSTLRRSWRQRVGVPKGGGAV